MAITTASPSTISPLVQRDAADGPVLAAHQRADRAVPQRRAVLLGGAHQARGEGAGLDQRRRLRGAEPARDRHALRTATAAGRYRERVVLDGVSAIGRQDADSPRDCPARRRARRAGRSCAGPVDRAGCRGTSRAPGSRLTCRRPRRRFRDALSRWARTASAEEVGDGDTDRAAAADDDTFGPAHAISVSGSAWLGQTLQPGVFCPRIV